MDGNTPQVVTGASSVAASRTFNIGKTLKTNLPCPRGSEIQRTVVAYASVTK